LSDFRSVFQSHLNGLSMITEATCECGGQSLALL
jgi:hypothetical protein